MMKENFKINTTIEAQLFLEPTIFNFTTESINGKVQITRDNNPLFNRLNVDKNYIPFLVKGYQHFKRECIDKFRIIDEHELGRFVQRIKKGELKDLPFNSLAEFSTEEATMWHRTSSLREPGDPPSRAYAYEVINQLKLLFECKLTHLTYLKEEERVIRHRQYLNYYIGFDKEGEIRETDGY